MQCFEFSELLLSYISICLTVDVFFQKGFLGSSTCRTDCLCTNHMMGEKKMFISYIKNKDSQDSIIFGDGNQGKVKGLGKIAIYPSIPFLMCF
jgi:hypothetical protein